MPGITVIENPPDRDVIDDVLDSVCFTDSYLRTDVVDDSSLVVSHTGYDQYPTEVFETDEWTLVLEGYLYGADDVEATVTDVIPLLSEGRTDDLSEWVTARDGDFLLVAVDHESGTTWAVNDVFARLPTFRAQIGGRTIVTRELKVIRDLAHSLEGDLEADSLGLGQLLLFGYPLGTRTLFDGVEQLPPGSVLEVGPNETESLNEHRLDRHTNAQRSVAENAKLLRDRFVEACANRASVVDESIISLSGGLDSRSVVAGYASVDGDATVTAATSARKDGGNKKEVDTARKVAASVDVPWTSYIADWTDRHQELLLEATQGMNNLSMSIGLDFAEQLAGDHDSAMLVTGDGISIPDRFPRQDVDSMSELVDALLTGWTVFSMEDVTALVDVDAAELEHSLRRRLESYPETTLDGMHLHFYFRERGVNFQNHGEDRTRYYMWSTTPAYAPEFFTESMACPPAQKRGTRLSRAFLSELSPRVVEIDYVDYDATIDSLEYRVKRFAYEWLLDHPALKRRLLGLLGRSTAGSTVDTNPPRELVYEPNNSPALERYFSTSDIQRIAWSNGAYSAHQQNLLLTAVSAITYGEEEENETDSAPDVEPISVATGHE